MFDPKYALRKKVKEIELSEEKLPFLLTFGVVNKYCRVEKIGLNQIGDSQHLIPLFFLALEEGCKATDIKNPFTPELFEVFVEGEDIETLSKALESAMPQDGPTEGEEPTEGNEANQ